MSKVTSNAALHRLHKVEGVTGKVEGNIPVTRKGEPGYGTAIVEAHRQALTSVAKCIKLLVGKDQATLLLAIEEVEQGRAGDLKEWAGKLGEKTKEYQRKRQSLYSTYTRILRIIRAIKDGVAVQAIAKAPHELAMVEAIQLASGNKKRHTSMKALNKEQVKQHLRNAGRYITAKLDDEAFPVQAARLEKLFVMVAGLVYKYKDAMRPVGELLKQAEALAKPAKRHLRKAA